MAYYVFTIDYICAGADGLWRFV